LVKLKEKEFKESKEFEEFENPPKIRAGRER
jgi:hypothetical protein